MDVCPDCNNDLWQKHGHNIKDHYLQLYRLCWKELGYVNEGINNKTIQEALKADQAYCKWTDEEIPLIAETLEDMLENDQRINYNRDKGTLTLSKYACKVLMETGTKPSELDPFPKGD